LKSKLKESHDVINSKDFYFDEKKSFENSPSISDKILRKERKTQSRQRTLEGTIEPYSQLNEEELAESSYSFKEKQMKEIK